LRQLSLHSGNPQKRRVALRASKSPSFGLACCARQTTVMPDPSSTRLRCELCQVEIDRQPGLPDQVLFSRGPSGSRSKLWARVCQYLTSAEQKGRCINQDPTLRGEEKPGDRYEDLPAIDLGNQAAG
jgi:hypothetical protein